MFMCTSTHRHLYCINMRYVCVSTTAAYHVSSSRLTRVLWQLTPEPRPTPHPKVELRFSRATNADDRSRRIAAGAPEPSTVGMNDPGRDHGRRRTYSRVRMAQTSRSDISACFHRVGHGQALLCSRTAVDEVGFRAPLTGVHLIWLRLMNRGDIFDIDWKRSKA